MSLNPGTADTITRTVKLRRVSSSIVCTIPQAILDIAGLVPGDYVIVSGNGDGIVIRKADNRKADVK